MLRGGKHDQHGGRITVGVALSPAEDAFAVLPQDLETAIPANVDPRGSAHPPDSTVRPAIALRRD
jgi:hypothetical protein